MPSGKKSMTLPPLALCRQNARAVESLGRNAAEQVSDANWDGAQFPPQPRRGQARIMVGDERDSGQAGEVDDEGQKQDFAGGTTGGARKPEGGTTERPTSREG